MGLLASLGGALIGGAFSFLGGERRNSAQAKATQATNDTSIELANTAYQRSMKDMKAAGLNPILAGKLGGASTPSIQTPQFQDTITPAVNSAVSAMQAQSTVSLQDTQGDVNQANVEKIEQEIKNLAETNKYTQEQVKQIAWAIEKLRADIDKTMTETIGIDYSNITNAVRTQFLEENPNLLKAGEVSRQLGITVGDLTKMLNISILKGLKGLFKGKPKGK